MVMATSNSPVHGNTFCEEQDLAINISMLLCEKEKLTDSIATCNTINDNLIRLSKSYFNYYDTYIEVPTWSTSSEEEKDAYIKQNYENHKNIINTYDELKKYIFIIN